MRKRLAIFFAYSSGLVAAYLFGIAAFLADSETVSSDVIQLTRILGGAAIVVTVCAAFEALSSFLDEN